MSVTPKRLYSGTPAAGPAVVYTAPAGGADILVIVATNATGGAQTITVTVAGAAVLGAKSVPAADFVRLAGPIHLASGETISIANPSGAIAVTISGVEYT